MSGLDNLDVKLELKGFDGQPTTPRDLLQDIQDVSRDAQIARQAHLLEGLEVDAPEVNGVAGPHRRLKLEVPTPDGGGTRLGMGFRWAGMNYDGFGVDTVGHVVMNARAAGSTITLQAKGQILVQSEEDSLYLVSKAPAIMASADASNVVGGSGVLIAGGFPMNPVNPSVIGAAPTVPEATKSHAEWMSTIGNFWSMVDAGVAAISVARVLAEKKAGVPVTWASAVGACFNAANAINNTLGVCGSGVGGVTIHGLGGLTMGTPGTCGVYAGLGLTMASTYAGLIGTVEVEVLGQAAKLNGLTEATVFGGMEASLVADNGTAHLASRKGDLEILAGRDLRVGVLAPLPPQEATQMVAVGGRKQILMHTDAARHVKELGIHARSHDEMSFRSKGKHVVASESKLLMGIGEEPADLAIAVAKEEGSVTANAKEARLALLADKRAVLSYETKQGFVATTNAVAINVGGSPAISITKSLTMCIKRMKKVHIL